MVEVEAVPEVEVEVGQEVEVVARLLLAHLAGVDFLMEAEAEVVVVMVVVVEAVVAGDQQTLLKTPQHLHQQERPTKIHHQHQHR